MYGTLSFSSLPHPFVDDYYRIWAWVVFRKSLLQWYCGSSANLPNWTTYLWFYGISRKLRLRNLAYVTDFGWLLHNNQKCILFYLLQLEYPGGHMSKITLTSASQMSRIQNQIRLDFIRTERSDFVVNINFPELYLMELIGTNGWLFYCHKW